MLQPEVAYAYFGKHVRQINVIAHWDVASLTILLLPILDWNFACLCLLQRCLT